MLQQFNVVVTGSSTSTSHVQGRAFIGGTANGGEYMQLSAGVPASNYAGLTVGGSADNIKVDNKGGAVIGGSLTANNTTINGDAYVGGSSTNAHYTNGDVWINGAADNVQFGGLIHAASYNNINLNGKILNAPTSTMQSTLAASTSTDFSSVLKGLSSQLAALKNSNGASVAFAKQDKDVTFNFTGTGSVAVFDLTEYDTRIFTGSLVDFHFNLGSATTVIFNTDNTTLNLNANFNNGSNLGSKLIWNFTGENTAVTIGNTMAGQVLVADGSFRNNNGNVDGGVYAKTLYQYGEIHQQTFTGTLPAVPEPGTYAMLLAGLGLMGFMKRRFRA
ncbi:choice-of-anchor A family protein [Pseudoduganella sp. FT55W]|uniref:Choice-of-anchor A family protein n=2 Tax=Duganella rivi TaxID=2666083 RepID=A0A7X4GMJ7_9BURK|nr:choice-of-anchor A family protein [Duganella rivi]